MQYFGAEGQRDGGRGPRAEGRGSRVEEHKHPLTAKNVHEKQEESKNISGWKPSKNKNIESHLNFSGSYKEKCNYLILITWAFVN